MTTFFFFQYSIPFISLHNVLYFHECSSLSFSLTLHHSCDSIRVNDFKQKLTLPNSHFELVLCEGGKKKKKTKNEIVFHFLVSICFFYPLADSLTGVTRSNNVILNMKIKFTRIVFFYLTRIFHFQHCNVNAVHHIQSRNYCANEFCFLFFSTFVFEFICNWRSASATWSSFPFVRIDWIFHFVGSVGHLI